MIKVLLLLLLLKLVSASGRPQDYWFGHVVNADAVGELQSGYTTATLDHERPSACYYISPTAYWESRYIVAYSKKGNVQKKVNSTLTIRYFDHDDWQGSVEDYNKLGHYKNIYTAKDYLPRTFQSSIANDQFGNFIVVFSDISQPTQFLLYSVTKDRGVTWSTPKTIVANDVEVAKNVDPKIVYNQNTSTWYVSWSSGKTTNGAGTDLDIAIVSSNNTGTSWSSLVWGNPNALTDTADDVNPRLILAIDDMSSYTNKVLQLFYSTQNSILGGSDWDIFVSSSYDKGKTFSNERLIYPESMSVDQNDENSFDVAIDKTTSREIVVVFRTKVINSANRLVSSLYSLNGGFSFSNVSETILTVSNTAESDSPPTVTSNNDGLFITAFASRKTTSRIGDSDYFEDPYAVNVFVGNDTDIFYSFASTIPLGIPGTGWLRPRVLNVENTFATNKVNEHPVLLFGHKITYFAIFESSQLNSDNHLDIMFNHYKDILYELENHNGLGMRSAFSVKGIQSRIDAAPNNSDVVIPIGSDIYFGDDDLKTSEESRSIHIRDGKNVKLVASVNSEEMSFELWTTDFACWFPFFIVHDSLSGLTIDFKDIKLYYIQTSYFVKNAGNSSKIFLQPIIPTQSWEYWGFYSCRTNAWSSVDFRSCPYGYRAPGIGEGKYCIPCPAGKECTPCYYDSQNCLNSAYLEIKTCPAGRYCPLGTFDSTYTKCGEFKYYNSTSVGLSSKEQCLNLGRDCEVGYWCPPGTLQSEYVKVINGLERIAPSYLETLVYPSDKTYTFEINKIVSNMVSNPPFDSYCFLQSEFTCPHSYMCMNAKGECSWDGEACLPETVVYHKYRTGCRQLIQMSPYSDNVPDWISMDFRENSDDYGTTDAVLDGNTLETNYFVLSVHSQTPEYPLSQTLKSIQQIGFYSLWSTFPYYQPVIKTNPIFIQRSVTTVIFNPTNSIDLVKRLGSSNFSSNPSLFNIGCEDSLTWNTTVWDCSKVDPLDWLSVDVTRYPVNWVKTDAKLNSGAISVGSTEPATMGLLISPQSITSRSSVVPADFSGLTRYQACMRVLIVLASDVNGVLIKDMPINLDLFEDCPAGYYSESGTSENGACTACEPGTYTNTTGTTVCRGCPEAFPRSVLGARSINDCQAAPGSFRDLDGNSVLCSKLGPGVSCLQEGLTLETIPLISGYWRSNNRSKSVLKCPNPAYCIGGLSTRNATNTSRRRRLSLTEQTSYCYDHHRGPFCEVCENGYVKRGLATCSLCTEDSYKADEQRLFWTIFAACLIVVFAFLLTQRQRLRAYTRRRAESLVHTIGNRINHRAGSIVEAMLIPSPSVSDPRSNMNRNDSVASLSVRRRQLTASLSRRAKNFRDPAFKNATLLWSTIVRIEGDVTLRILISLFQVLGGISKTFTDLYPDIYKQIVSVLNTLSAEVFYNIDFACVIHSNHYLTLILGLLAPIIATLLILLVHFVFERRIRKLRRWSDIEKLRTGSFTLFLVLLFLIYPSVSSTILSSFLCKTFDDGTSWLRKDITISCDEPDRWIWILIASFGVIIYVVGIPSTYIYALYRVRHEINPKDKSQKPDKTRFANVLFLTEIYKREYFYWEVIELFRKLVQSSLVIFLLDGSVFQMIVLIATAMIFIQAINVNQPYRTLTANYLAAVAQWEILLVSFLGLLLKVDIGTLDANFNYNKNGSIETCLVLAVIMCPVYAIYQRKKDLRELFRFIYAKLCRRTYIPSRTEPITTNNRDSLEKGDSDKPEIIAFDERARSSSSKTMKERDTTTARFSMEERETNTNRFSMEEEKVNY